MIIMFNKIPLNLTWFYVIYGNKKGEVNTTLLIIIFLLI